LEIEDLLSSTESEASLSWYTPYSLYRDLSIRIKRSLTCARTSPDVKIVMPFDALSFNGGLKSLGTPSNKYGGIQHYTIKEYKDLNDILGYNWHVRGINCNVDYGYAIKETINFYLRKCRDLVEFLPPSPGNFNIHSINIDAGYTLTFIFTAGYGNARTFGKDKVIFYDT